MHYYKKNIGDYHKKAGRLSMLQHGAYTLLMDSCYDRERFPTHEEAIDWTWASSKEEVEAVEFVLRKFFTLIDGVYVQSRIHDELQSYKIGEIVNRLIAISREARKKKNTKLSTACDELRAEIKHDPLSKTHAAWTLLVEALIKQHEPAPNQEPLTKNQEPLTNIKEKESAQSSPSEPLTQPAAVDDKTTITTLPTNQFSTRGETFRVTDDMLPDWEAAYPAVDVLQELNKIKAWLQDNPTKRKTVRGMRKFIGSWLSRQQDRGLANAAHRPGGHSGQNRQSKSDAIREATFSNDW